MAERAEVKKEPTNKEFAETNEEFKLACQACKIPNSTRQASKWRAGKGKAFTKAHTGRKIILE